MIADVDNPNLVILEMAVQALGDLTDSLVFVGGCATGLLVTRIRANQILAGARPRPRNVVQCGRRRTVTAIAAQDEKQDRPPRMSAIGRRRLLS